MSDARGEPPIRVIMGPTAAGKSAIAMALAEEFSLGIISADSRQIYTGFDIGTAKPSVEERRRVPHWGIDVCTPADRYSAHQWATDVATWSAEARARECEPVVVGGTGFYVRALVDPLGQAPPLDPERREALATHLDTMDSDELERWCVRLDAARAHLGRTQRLRAVETALLTGTRLSDALTVVARPSRRARYLVVDPGVGLAARIEQRVRSMFDGGWIDEVRRLSASVPADAPAWNASGYGAIREVLTGALTVQEAQQRVLIETRQYAKRQRTWYRHQLPATAVTMLDSSAPDAIAQAAAWWNSDEGIES